MGTWDIGYFDNDMASDWLHSLEDNPINETFLESLEMVIDGDNSSDATSEAIASIAIISSVFEHNEYVNNHIEENEIDIDLDRLRLVINRNLIVKAKMCLDKILADSDNELFGLWNEEDLSKQWLDSLRSLESKLSQINM